jgi:hypothetical protein
MTEYDAPRIDRMDARDGYTVRLRAKSNYTQKEGWRPADITVEYTGAADHLPANLFRDRTMDLYGEIDEACTRINIREGRA